MIRGKTKAADVEIVADAFGETANPDEYVPRPACEAVLRRLEEVVFEARAPAALIAPPGLGKSMLLRVFAQRTGGRADAVELAYGALSFEDLCEWVLLLAGESVTGSPAEDLESRLERRDLLLAIDDASSLPPASARALGALARRRPRLRVILAAAEGYLTSRVLAAFGEPLQRLHFSEPMDPDESCAYMAHRLEYWGASRETIEHLEPGPIARVLRLSGGVPRRLHGLVQQLLADQPHEVPAQWRDEHWLGAPLDELSELDRPIEASD